MSATATDELVSAARDLAALLRDNYMLPNTWPASRRFLAAVEALDGPPRTSDQEQGSPTPDPLVALAPQDAPAAEATPGAEPEQSKPERQSRAPLT